MTRKPAPPERVYPVRFTGTTLDEWDEFCEDIDPQEVYCPHLDAFSADVRAANPHGGSGFGRITSLLNPRTQTQVRLTGPLEGVEQGLGCGARLVDLLEP